MAKMASLNQEKRYFNMTYQQIKDIGGAGKCIRSVTSVRVRAGSFNNSRISGPQV